MTHSNRQIWLKARPNGIPPADDFAIRQVPLPEPADGEFLVRNEYLSVDPAMRGWTADTSTYWPRIEMGETIRAFAAGEVIASRHPDYAAGDKVNGTIAPTGKEIRVPCCDVFHLVAGKVTSFHCYVAVPVLLGQLGAVMNLQAPLKH